MCVCLDFASFSLFYLCMWCRYVCSEKRRIVTTNNNNNDGILNIYFIHRHLFVHTQQHNKKGILSSNSFQVCFISESKNVWYAYVKWYINFIKCFYCCFFVVTILVSVEIAYKNVSKKISHTGVSKFLLQLALLVRPIFPPKQKIGILIPENLINFKVVTSVSPLSSCLNHLSHLLSSFITMSSHHQTKNRDS